MGEQGQAPSHAAIRDAMPPSGISALAKNGVFPGMIAIQAPPGSRDLLSDHPEETRDRERRAIGMARRAHVESRLPVHRHAAASTAAPPRFPIGHRPRPRHRTFVACPRYCLQQAGHGPRANSTCQVYSFPARESAGSRYEKNKLAFISPTSARGGSSRPARGCPAGLPLTRQATTDVWPRRYGRRASL